MTTTATTTITTNMPIRLHAQFIKTKQGSLFCFEEQIVKSSLWIIISGETGLGCNTENCSNQKQDKNHMIICVQASLAALLTPVIHSDSLKSIFMCFFNCVYQMVCVHFIVKIWSTWLIVLLRTNANSCVIICDEGVDRHNTHVSTNPAQAVWLWWSTYFL